MYCTDIPNPAFYIFSEFTPQILYYSHIPTALIALFLGVLLLSRERSLRSWLLFITTILFSVWSISDIVLWTNNDSRIIMFVWSFINLLQGFITACVLLFSYVSLSNKKIPILWLYALAVIFLPKIIFLTTSLNIESFHLDLCEANEGIFISYYYFTEILLHLWIISFLINIYKKSPHGSRRKVFIFSIGTILFTASFSSANLIAAYTGNWEILQYGLFGMPIFIGFLVYLVVEYKIYNINIIGSQALVVSLWFMIGSLIFVAKTSTTKIVAAATLVAAIVSGYLLIRSVKSEIKHREEIQRLAKNLEKANARLTQMDKLKSEFVSIASHQLRSPITAISGYASLLREGSYGQLPPKMMEPIERIERSARMMVSSIEDYLNVSRIESGNMKYDNVDFNLVDEVEHICDDLRTEALRNGLILLFKKKIESRGIIHADLGKIQQVIHNLINNSLKYTQKGTITVYVHDSLKDKKISVDVIDTGIGMSESTLNTIFQKFERGDKANSVNVKGTGLGLFVALKIAEAMGGTIEAFSEGEGKGSRFTIELPLVM